jgi:hypothetical protein
MRRLLVVLAACGQTALPPLQPKPVPRLLAPRPIDPAARGATYLTAVALQLQPGWGQFLDDCRLRLPAAHPLNDMALAATAELVVARDGRIESVTVATSKNPDFDRAVRDAVADAGQLAAPPAELLSDDDKVHLRWLFARDRRQAGPATAEVLDVQQPLNKVIATWTNNGELARAARRIAYASPSRDLDAWASGVMVAALREGLGSSDGTARRAALVAIGRATLTELGDAVDARLSDSDEDLRLAAIDAAGKVFATRALALQLPIDLKTHRRFALAEARSLGSDEIADATRDVLDNPHANPDARGTALEVLQYAPRVAARYTARFGRGEALERAGACHAAGVVDDDATWAWIAKGLRDAEATVRAACVEATHAQAAHHYDKDKRAFDDRHIAPLLERIRELAHDRDRAVRARAITALAIDADHPVRAADDPAAEVRAAYAATIPAPPTPQQATDLRALLEDRDPDVRAAAWAREAVLVLDPEHDVRATGDPAAQVRRAALPTFDNEVLAHLAASDDSPDVRTDALVLLAQRRGRAEMTRPLLERLAAAPPASAERVRVALAWLLAK